MFVLPGTSEIHSHTFATALGWRVDQKGGLRDVSGVTEFGDKVLWVGPNPGQKAIIKDLRDAGAKVMAYWIGSDSMVALQDPEYRGHIPECDYHIAVHERIKKELSTWAIPSSVVWPCARNASKQLSKAPQPKVGVYMPHKGPLYQYDLTMEIIRDTPELPFVLFGGMEPYDNLPENCTDAGRLSPEEAGELQNSFSCILRLCFHDGNPIGGIETLQRGRNIITNYPYDGFLYAKTYEDACTLLGDPKTHEENTGPWPAYYRERCGKEYFKNEVYKIIEGEHYDKQRPSWTFIDGRV